MMKTAGDPPLIRFGVFELDRRTGELRKAGRKLQIQEQSYRVLLTLLERPGEMVTRDELRQKLWQQDTFVDFDTGLNKAITKVRGILGDSAESPRFIETLPRRGYRFIAPVDPQPPAEIPADAGPSPPVESHRVPFQRSFYRRRHVKLAAAGLVIVLLAVTMWFRRPHSGSAASIRSIAVLPLENLSGDSSQEYFADGMTDELITELAEIHTLRVISRTSVMQFKHTKRKLPEIARELNVDAVIEGSVLRSGNHVRVTAQLLDARQDRHLWAASYQGELTDIVGLQGQVAKAIADQVTAKLTPEEAANLARRRPTNPESYDALLRGRFVRSRRTPAAQQKAIGHFRQAVEIDPNNAPAWAALADSYTSLGADLGVADPAKVLPQARATIAKALELDGNLAEAHAVLAWMKLWYDWDWAGSEREFHRAIELNPNESSTHRYYAHFLQLRKRFDEALKENRRAIDLAPLDILASIHLAWLYVDAHEAEKAIGQSKQVLEMDPAFAGAHLWLARGYELEGKWPEAIAAYEHAKESYSRGYIAGVATVWAASGNRPRAQSALAEIREFSKDNYVSPVLFAQYYAALGDRDRAFEWLQRAYRERATGLISLHVNHWFDSLRSDPRFRELERRVGF